jgi:hypothetical protein
MAFQLCGRGWPESRAKTRDECNAQRSITSEGVDKAFWVDAVVLEVLQLSIRPVVGWQDAPPGIFGL